MEHEGGFTWETSTDASVDFHVRDDAVARAYCNDIAETSAM